MVCFLVRDYDIKLQWLLKASYAYFVVENLPPPSLNVRMQRYDETLKPDVDFIGGILLPSEVIRAQQVTRMHRGDAGSIIRGQAESKRPYCSLGI